jgi:hypothetical protein
MARRIDLNMRGVDKVGSARFFSSTMNAATGIWFYFGYRAFFARGHVGARRET